LRHDLEEIHVTPPSYGPPPNEGYGPPAGSPPQNTQGLIGFILGIVSIPLACCGWGGLVLGVAGAVLGFLGKKKAAEGLATNGGQANAGFICGIIGAVLGILIIILSFSVSALDWQQYINENS
jgi:hypothetical protein